jgi:oligoendopeptidase F
MPFIDLNSHRTYAAVRSWSKKENQRAKERRRLAISRIIDLRVEEAHTLADMMDTDYARKQMLAIARGYDRLLQYTHQRTENRK